MVTLFLLLAGPSGRAEPVDDAFQSLVQGRAYLKGFPSGATRNQMVDAFLGLNGGVPTPDSLKLAVKQALAIRNGEPAEPEAFPAGEPPVSLQAKVIAWEALESMLTGYNYAGNRDLLAATRQSYPGSNAATDSRPIPPEEPQEFRGIPQRNLGYARLYFLQGVREALDYIAQDPTGKLRAVDSIYPAVPQYTSFDEERGEVLPHPRFDDPNFGGPAIQDREGSQTVAHLYGGALARYGLASVSYSEQLWRSAYTGPGAGAKRTEADRQAMLNRSVEVLRDDVHAQFLASLPLAAQLDDGRNGTPNEYEQAQLREVRTSVTGALRLREQILSGERPTHTGLVGAWDPATLQQQMSRTLDAFEAARLKWGGDASPPADGSVAFELARTEQSQSQIADREIQLRNSMETQLLEITGIDPGIYAGLRDGVQRVAYRQAIRDKFDSLINGGDPNAAGLRDGSQMSSQALRIIQSLREVEAQRARIDSYPQRMRVELERNGDVNATITSVAEQRSVIDMAIAVANAIHIEICYCGTSSGTTTTFNPKGLLVATLQQVQALGAAQGEARINSINSTALIQNLLIEQFIAIEELGVVALNSQIARAELRRLLAVAERQVDNHVFFQNITDTLWYRDPSLAFRLEKAEEEYQSLLQEFRIELYKLTRMLEASWIETFSNPVRQGNGSTIEALNNGSFDDFTDATSVFGIANHVQGRQYFNALKAWDQKLREPLFRGPNLPTLWDANAFSGQPISVRRDILGLIDYRYNSADNRYEVDPVLSRQSVSQFRAKLLDLASRDPANAGGLSRLRIDFPLTYSQARVILGQDNPVPIVQQNRPGGTVDQFWNHRVREVGVKVVGKNVFAAGNTVPVSLELHGTVDRVGFFMDSLNIFTRQTSTVPLALYQRDPDRRLVGEPFFGTAVGIPAAIGATPVPMNPVPGWPLFCDNIVLRIGSQGTLRLENIEDIEFYLKMEVGSPPLAQWP